MDYRIVIPSYKRAETIKEKTLTTLKQCNINPALIDIFVADKKEYNIYKKSLDPTSYNKLIIGVPKIPKQRNFIRSHYAEKQKLFMMDDDVAGFYIKSNNKLKPFYKLDTLIQYGFKLMKKHNTNLCGVYPVFNHFFMKNTISKGLYFIVGCAFWNINSHDPQMYLDVAMKDDYQLCIKEYLKSGAVLRFNNITIKTNYYTEKGGLNGMRTTEKVDKSVKYLLKKYPKLIELNPSRKNQQFTEIKFKPQKNNTSFKLK